MEIDVKVKAWGNSAGVIIPKEFLEKNGIKKGDSIKIKIQKKDVFDEIRGTLKNYKKKTNLSVDEMIADADEGWSKYD